MRNVPLVFIRAENSALLQRVLAMVGEAFEVDGGTVPESPPEVVPSAVILVAQRLGSPWVRAAGEWVGNNDWWRRTIFVSGRPESMDDSHALGRLKARANIFFSELDTQPLQRILGSIVIWSRTGQAIRGMNAIFGLRDDTSRILFLASPPLRSVKALGRTKYLTADGLRARWRRAHLAGTPKALIDRVLVIRIAWEMDEGLTPPQAFRKLRIPSATGYGAVGRVVGGDPGQLSSATAWKAVEEWKDVL